MMREWVGEGVSGEEEDGGQIGQTGRLGQSQDPVGLSDLTARPSSCLAGRSDLTDRLGKTKSQI